jgi:predicted nuclease of restriction endonuclease-like RecB superfamily
MAFASTDFKKTSRTIDGTRMLYPHQLRDDRYLAAISYAIDYYERMVGRPRREMQVDTLLEFFGDPKLARGIVACLGRTYVWQQPTFRDVLDRFTWQTMQQLGLDRPVALRAYLYRYANQHHGGFLASSGRAVVIEALCAELPIDRRTFEKLLTLDASANAILTKVAGTPSARDIVASYNYHSIETALRHTSHLELTLNGPIWSLVRTIHNVSRRYGLEYKIDYGGNGLFAGSVTVEWLGKRDALGKYQRYGRRIVRALLRLLAAHPDGPMAGRATVHIQGKTLVYQLNDAALKTLGVVAQRTGRGEEAWEIESVERLLGAWNKAYLRGETNGWRLRRDPEPLITDGGIIVPDFLALRGQQRAYVVLAHNRAAADALRKPLEALNGRTIVVVATEAAWAKQLASTPAIIVPHVSEPSALMLARSLPAITAQPHANETKWQRMERVLHTEGFISEGRLAELLHCGPEMVPTTLRGWHSDDASYLPGIGLCSVDTMQEIRSFLHNGARERQVAA